MKLFKSYMVLVCYAIGNYYVDHNKSENYFVVRCGKKTRQEKKY